MTERVINFSSGPAVLPLPVLQTVQRDLLALPGVGSSVLEISHRSPSYLKIQTQAEDSLRRLLAIPDEFKVLFLQGGSRLQFSMVPLNLLAGDRGAAEYVLTGSWGKKALEQAQLAGATHVAWDGGDTKYDRVPAPGALRIDQDAAYAHITSNETIQGVQFPDDLDLGEVPVVCDASSDFLSRPIDVSKYGLIYACAQKNAGPAGVTVVVIREDLLTRSRDDLPGMLNYRLHAENDSGYNTPPVFAVYVLGLVAQWLLNDIGGLDAIAERNAAKAKMLYDVIDASPDFYLPHADPSSRSLMNVTFRLPSDTLQARFLEQATAAGLCGLKGHRSVGGIRASIYNAMPVKGVAALAEFMTTFRDQSR